MNAPIPTVETSTLALMKAARRWLLRTETKQPIYTDGTARRGTLDTPEDIGRLVTYDEAEAALDRLRPSRPELAGLGFALGPDEAGGYWQGIDLDHISVRPDLEAIGDDLPGYVEISIGGDGLHAIGYGPAFRSGSRNGVEAYSVGRYFTFSGLAVRDSALTDLAPFVASRLPLALGTSHTANTSEAAQEGLGCIPVQPCILDDLRSALGHLRPLATKYHEWIAIGVALADPNLNGAGKDLWLEWSASDPRFAREQAEKKWGTFRATATCYASVFAKAQAAGWINPRAGSGGPGAVGEWRRAEMTTGFRFVHVRDLLSKPRPVDWLIDDLIEEGTLCQLFGASKAGKSFMALDWSASIATGRDWCGRKVAQGSVFYIVGEGHRGLSRRLRAWEIHRAQALTDAPLHLSTVPAALIDTGNATAVAECISVLEAQVGRPKLIVIDTLARNFGNGEESSNADIGRFIQNLDALLKSRFDAAVLIVHHTGHGEQERARGASALHAAMDHEFRLDAKDGVRQLVTTKNKEGDIPEPMTFSLESVHLDWLGRDGLPMSSAVLIPTAAQANRFSLKGAKLVALDALRKALTHEGRPPSAKAMGATGDGLEPTVVVPDEAWRRYAYAAGISSGDSDAKRKAYNRQQNALFAEGYVCRHGDEWWLLSPSP